MKNRTLRTVIFTLMITVFSVGSTGFVTSDFQISKHLEIFANLLKKLHTNYVDEIKTGELVKTGIDAMLKKLDPYTVFVPESEIEDLTLLTKGEYGGIGSVIQKRGDYVQIATVYQGFPAHNEGLNPGDRILKVDGKDVKGRSSGQVSDRLKGQEGSEVSVTILRPVTNDTLDFTLTRENIKVDNIPYYGVTGNNLGFIKLTNFTENTGNEVREAFEELNQEHELDGVILDLRNNGGGLLREAVKIVNIFVPKGEFVVETRGKLSEKNKKYKTTDDPADTEIPVTVLVNGNSASASEIVAGALQDMDRGVIVGETTFGKGLVQNIIPLSYNTRMKVTVAKYYIPSGRCIQAIDYSDTANNKDVPDSLKQKYTTKGGRVVYDGAGIYPDIEIKNVDYLPIAKALMTQQMVFDFATRFYYQNDSIDSPHNFSVSDETYKQFSEFLEEKNFSYQTGTEKKLTEFKETAKQEKYFGSIEKQLDELKKQLHHDKDQDLIDFRKEIEQILKMEIIGRYYFRRGTTIASLHEDKQINKAISVLHDNEAYHEILQSGSN